MSGSFVPLFQEARRWLTGNQNVQRNFTCYEPKYKPKYSNMCAAQHTRARWDLSINQHCLRVVLPTNCCKASLRTTCTGLKNFLCAGDLKSLISPPPRSTKSGKQHKIGGARVVNPPLNVDVGVSNLPPRISDKMTKIDSFQQISQRGCSV